MNWQSHWKRIPDSLLVSAFSYIIIGHRIRKWQKSIGEFHVLLRLKTCHFFSPSPPPRLPLAHRRQLRGQVRLRRQAPLPRWGVARAVGLLEEEGREGTAEVKENYDIDTLKKHNETSKKEKIDAFKGNDKVFFILKICSGEMSYGGNMLPLPKVDR